MTETRYATTWWTSLDDGRIRCDVCPRACALHDGQTGLCFVRMRGGDQIVLTTYGRSSGFCVDPIEKKPLFPPPLDIGRYWRSLARCVRNSPVSASIRLR
jgi:hypothetical protein